MLTHFSPRYNNFPTGKTENEITLSTLVKEAEQVLRKGDVLAAVDFMVSDARVYVWSMCVCVCVRSSNVVID